jgi:pyruvate kinase
MRDVKTKIICTIGPASSDMESLEMLATEGMDACRLNFSHGSWKEKEIVIKNIRNVSKKLDKHIAIIADLQGPKLRLGSFEGVRELEKGEDVVLSTIAEKGQIPLQFDLSKYMKEGERIFINDGLVELVVNNTAYNKIYATALNSGWITSNKGVNVPDSDIIIDTFTKKDEKDAQFAIDNGVDYLALSYILNAEDVKTAKKLVDKSNEKTGIIAKIEKLQAVENLEAIVEVCDAVMVARGDLAVETSPARVPLLQQKIIKISRHLHKPVIVATHMLESMTVNPRPTRAEASDVANAVLTQVDAVMLSAETAVGKYPVESVKTMKEIIFQVEEDKEFKRYIRTDWEKITPEKINITAITSSASSLAYKLRSRVIAVATASGKTAVIVSASRPDAKIAGITHDVKTANLLSVVWGVVPFVVEPTNSSDEFWPKIANTLISTKLAKKGENIVAIGGSKLIGVSGATDTIKVIKL